MINEVLLTSICRPKQWKTISSSDLHNIGFPVYGANGKIGFYNTYTHEYPTVLITCRGATCGTINICEPKSYVNGNAMALDNLSSNVDMYYLKHYLEYRKLDDVISGSAQPQITGQGLSKVKIPLPPLPQQQKIANILDAADALRQNDKALIAKYDKLTQALFLDMFGDPVNNPKGWKILPLKKFGAIITGNTPSRNNNEFYSSSFIEWIKTDNITNENIYVTTAKEYLSEIGLSNSRYAEKGSLLVACIAGSINSIGRASLTDRKVSFNQQINAIQPNSDVSSFFLYHLFKNTSKYVQDHATNGMKRILTKGAFEKIEMIKPSISLQNQFTERVALIEEQKGIAQKSIEKSEELFNSLLQKAFKGELV